MQLFVVGRLLFDMLALIGALHEKSNVFIVDKLEMILTMVPGVQD
jgi:hypothetical protein